MKNANWVKAYEEVLEHTHDVFALDRTTGDCLALGFGQVAFRELAGPRFMEHICNEDAYRSWLKTDDYGPFEYDACGFEGGYPIGMLVRVRCVKACLGNVAVCVGDVTIRRDPVMQHDPLTMDSPPQMSDKRGQNAD